MKHWKVPAAQKQVQGCVVWLTLGPERRKRSTMAAVLRHAALLLCQPSVIPPDRRVTAHFTKHAVTGTEAQIRKKERRKEAARWGSKGKAGIGKGIAEVTEVVHSGEPLGGKCFPKEEWGWPRPKPSQTQLIGRCKVSLLHWVCHLWWLKDNIDYLWHTRCLHWRP